VQTHDGVRSRACNGAVTQPPFLGNAVWQIPMSAASLLVLFISSEGTPPGYINDDKNIGRDKMRKSLDYSQQTGL